MSISITDTPLTLGGAQPLTAKNRVFLAPLTRGRCGRDMVPKKHSVDYSVQRASAGLLITEATAISKQAVGWSGAPGIFTAEHVAGWKAVTSAVHAAGGIIFLQLWHMGRQAHSDFFGLTPVSASALAAVGKAHLYDHVQKPYETPRALELNELPRVVEEYRHAASCAKEAGFDGVEIHSANGYLLDQFLQSTSNTRTDAYGGAVENRFRLLREVIAAVSTVFPPSRIAVRLSPNGVYGSMGSADNTETFTYAIKELDTLGLAFLHVMDGLAFGYHAKCDVMRAAHVRALFHGPLVGNCGYTKQGAEAVINAGALDAVAFGRLFLANPDLVERFRKGHALAEAPYSAYYEQKDDQTVGYTDFAAHHEKPTEGAAATA